MAQEDITFKLGLDAAGLQRGLTSVKSQFDGFAKSKFASLKEVFGVAAVTAGIKTMGDEMVKLQRSAEDVGASVGFMLTLQQMSEKFGGTAEDASVAMSKLAETIGQARMEGGAAADKFARFGISLYQTNGEAKSTEALFNDIADAYNGTADAALKAAIAVEFFGRTGRNINNILGEGAEGIANYRKTLLGIEVGLVAGDVDAIADAWRNLKEFVGGLSDAVKALFGRTIDGLGSIFRLLGSISTGKNPMEAWNQEMEFWENRDKPKAQETGTRASDQAGRVKEIETLHKARSASAAAQISDEAKLAQVEKERSGIEAKMLDTAAGSIEYLKLENELLAKGYEARKLQAEIAARIVAQEKLGQQLDAAAEQFKINDATKAELVMRKRIAELNEGDPARVGLEKQLEDLVQKRMKLEREANELELQQMIARQGEIDEELKGIGYAEDRMAERLKKKEERDKGLLEIAKKTQEIERSKLDILRQQGEAQERATRARQSLAEAKAARFTFSLGELAAADPRRFRGGVRESIIGARDVQRLEAMAMQANLQNDPKERDRLQGLADKRRESLGFLKKEERFPFKDLQESAKKSADDLAELLKSGNTKTQVAMGK